MKNISFKKHLVPLFHVLFWIVSFNFWNFILNPGVESIGVIDGAEVGWDFILILNIIFLIYCSMPFIWLVRRKLLWLKILIYIIFLIPMVFAFQEKILLNGSNDEIAVVADYFVKNFLYVLVYHLTIAGAVYYNLKVLVPRFLNQSKFRKFLLYASGLCIATAVLNFSLFDFFIDKLFPSLYYISYFRIWELILIVAAYIIFTSMLFLGWQYAVMLIEKRDAARNELSALKAQINPHFLFNNLNTIYSMATQNDRRTPETVLKLSDFLRYILYDTADETILLQKEVEIIETYISLQKERINPEMTSVEFETKGDFSEVRIAPLLLLPLVENCFKHGVGKDSGSIRIFVELRDKQLHFQTANAVALREFSGENGGIGIQNVEKRLNLIYPDRHSLEFQEENGIFKLEMKIQLA